MPDMGFPDGTTDLFINTGIHSPRKWPAEPFRWAHDNPAKNHDIDLIEAATADLGAFTTYESATSTRTFKTPLAPPLFFPVDQSDELEASADVTIVSSPPMSVASGPAPLEDMPSLVEGPATSFPTTLRSVTFPSFSFAPTSSAVAAPTAAA